MEQEVTPTTMTEILPYATPSPPLIQQIKVEMKEAKGSESSSDSGEGDKSTEPTPLAQDPKDPALPPNPDEAAVPVDLHVYLSPLQKYSIILLLAAANFNDVFAYQSLLSGVAPMERDLNMSIPTGAWFLSGIAMAIAITSLVGGRLADVFGAKETFLGGESSASETDLRFSDISS